MSMVSDVVASLRLVGIDELSAPLAAAGASLTGLGEKATSTGGVVDSAFTTMRDAIKTVSGAFDGLAGSAAAASGKTSGSMDAAAGSTSGAAARMSAALDAAEASMAKLAASVEGAAAKMDSGMAKAGASSAGLATKVSESDRVIEERNLKAAESFKLIGDAAMATGVKTGEAGAMMMKGPLGLALGVGLAVGETIHMADKMETTFAKIQGNTGMTTKQMAQMRAETMKLGKEGPQSLDQVAAGFEHASNLGYRGADAMKVVTAGWKAAIATGGSTGDTVNALGTILRNFKIPVDQAGATMGVLLATAQNGNIHLPDLATNFSKTGIIASSIHMPIADAAAVYSALTRATGNAAQAQTLETGMLTHMINPTKAAITVMGELHQKTGIDLKKDFADFAAGHISFHKVMEDTRRATHGNATEIMTLYGGMRGGLGALKLVNSGWSDYNTISAKVHAGTTQLNDAFHNMMDTSSVKFETFKNKVEIGAIALGTKMLPAVGAVLDKLSAFSDWVGSHSKDISAFFDALGKAAQGVLRSLRPDIEAIKQAFMSVLPDLQRFGEAFGSFMSAHGNSFKSGLKDIQIVIETLAKAWIEPLKWLKEAGTEFLNVLESSKPLKAAMGQLGDAFGQIGTAIGQVTGGLKGLDTGHKTSGDGAKGFADILSSIVIPAVIAVADAIVAATPTIISLIKTIPPAIRLIADAIKEVQPIVAATMALITDIFHGNGQKIQADMDRLQKALIPLFNFLGEELKRLIDAALAYILAKIQAFASAALAQVESWSRAVLSQIESWASSALSQIETWAKAALAQIATWAGDVIQWFTDLPGKIAGGLAALGAAVIAEFVSLATGSVNELGKLKDKIGTWISERVTQFLNAAHSWVASMVTGLGDKIQSLISEASKIATAIFDTIKTFFTSHNPFSGLVDQAKNAVGAITGFLGGIGNGIGNAVSGHPLSGTGGGNGPFGLSGVTGTVQSGAAGAAAEGEAGLLGGRAPANDLDYLLPNGATQGVQLPGGKNAVYTLIKSYIEKGIGGIEEWAGPTGNRFAFLHMSQVAQTGTYHGGDVVGKTGWPTDPKYGNGQAGPGNSQLCIVYDASGNPMAMTQSQFTAAQAKGHGGGFGPALNGSRNGSGAYPYDPYGGEHNLPGARSDYAFSMPRGGEHYASGVQADYNTAQRNQYMGGFIGTGSSTGALGALAAQSPQHKYSSFGAAQADTGNFSASIVKLTGSLDKLSPEVAKTMKASIVAEAAQMQGYTSTYNAQYRQANADHVTAVAKIYSTSASQTATHEAAYRAAEAANIQSGITATAAAHEKYLKARGKIDDRFTTAQLNEGTSLQTARNNADRAQTQALARLSQTEGKRQENSNSALSKANTAANDKAAEDRRKETDRYNGILKGHGSATASQLRAHTARLKAITDTHSDKLATNLEKHPVKMAVVTGTHVTAFDRITQHHKNAFDNATRAHVVSFGKATRQHTLQMGYLTQAHVKDYGSANQKLTDANNKWLSQHKTNLDTALSGSQASFDKHIAGLKSGLTSHLNGLSAANAALVAKMREALTDHALWDGLAAHLSKVIGQGTKDLAYQIYKGTADQSHRVVTPGVDGERATISWVANNTGMLNSMADAMRKQEKQTNALAQAQAEAAELVGDFGKALAYYTAKDAKAVTKTQDRYIYDTNMGKGDPTADLAKYQAAWAKQQTDIGITNQAKLATDRSVGIYSTSQSDQSKGDTTAVTEASAKLAYDFQHNSAMVALDTQNLKEQTAQLKVDTESDTQARLVGDRALGIFATSLTDLASKTSGPAKMAMDAFTWGLVSGTGDAKVLSATMVSTAQADKAAMEQTNQAHLLADRLLGNFGTSLADSQKKVSDTYTTASNAFLYDSAQQSGATQQDISNLLASSEALKAHAASVTANIDAQNRITGSYTSSVATFTAQITGPLTEANAQYAYDLHNHTGSVVADMAAIQSATQGVQALGDESRLVAQAGMGAYAAAISNATALAASTAAAYENASALGVTGDALTVLYQKALDAGIALANAGDAAKDLASAISAATAAPKATKGGTPPLYAALGTPGGGPNAGMQGTAPGSPGALLSGMAANPGSTAGQYQAASTGTMPGGPAGSGGTIQGLPYMNGPSAPSGTPYYDPTTKLFYSNGGQLSIDMINNNSSIANGGGGYYQNPALPQGAFLSQGPNFGQTIFGGSAPPMMGSASGVNAQTAPGNLSQAFLNSRLHPISGGAGGSAQQPIYVQPVAPSPAQQQANTQAATTSASQLSTQQAQLTQLQQANAKLTASNTALTIQVQAQMEQMKQLAELVKLSNLGLEGMGGSGSGGGGMDTQTLMNQLGVARMANRG